MLGRNLLGTVVLLFLIEVSVARRCPIGYILYRNGDCIRLVVANEEGRLDVMSETALTECQKDGAYPPIIHDKESNDRLTDLYFHGVGWADMIIGKHFCMVCDDTTNKFRWADGSPLDFVDTIDKNMACKGNWVYQNGVAAGGVQKWFAKPGTTTGWWTITCIKSFNAHLDPICYDFEQFTSSDGETTACYQVSSDFGLYWTSAQSQCQDDFSSLASIHSKEENEFIQSLSVSKGYHTGLHIGANLSGKENKFGWIDGTDMDYNNFYAGFPMDDMGGCSAMELSSGKWMNDECSTKLPFVCKRDALTVTPTCGSRVYQPGEIITPPGYPRSASKPCDYFLKVDTGKIVELEILLLEANACCDHLLIYNGQFETEPFANLTGSDREGEIFRTTSTVNMMRVSWQPKGAVNVRGFAMTFRAV